MKKYDLYLVLALILCAALLFLSLGCLQETQNMQWQARGFRGDRNGMRPDFGDGNFQGRGHFPGDESRTGPWFGDENFPSQMKEALGLNADASDSEVKQALGLPENATQEQMREVIIEKGLFPNRRN
ncbi:MAG: hypothetical protein JW772_03425 [Candidatus Diapherotrites archaeon]|nr:hypothetical protein [Candidatus Diapherotrites archaeon]